MLLALKNFVRLIPKVDAKADRGTNDELAKTATALQMTLKWINPWSRLLGGKWVSRNCNSQRGWFRAHGA